MATAMSSTISSVPRLRVTKTIKEAAEIALKCPNITEQLKETCSAVIKDTDLSISTSEIKELHDILRQDSAKKSKSKVFLHELVEGAELFLPPRQPPPRDPELEKRIQKLKIEQENKEYRRMTKNVDFQSKGKMKLSFNEEVKSMNRQIIELGNFLVTVIAGFAFGYKGVEVAFGKVFPMQMLCGLIIGTIVFFVDLYFLMKYGVLATNNEDSKD